MIDALIAGRLQGQPSEKTGKNGKPYVIAKVRATAGDGDTLIVNVITFSDAVGDALLALDEGDSVALSGALTPKIWTDRDGQTRPALDLIAHQILTAYDVNRKREAAGEEAQP
ncbi:MAG TPA: single-stranded DNA-binding protein [Aquabacterium sp.]|uniref:single-stranded DNA-binding protein n=1 Tax=Aquabacterium sp. TaxID=1872578 RepID=UPI002E34C9C4|nr:single-stranded DNA-binding protein [Aquabacterium sp.]HEX5355481.1 single-stranded DNA-binding protein [Aquabacterium sp.]